MWVLGQGYDTMEPTPPKQRRRFHLALTEFLRGGMELRQIRDAVLQLARPADTERAEMAYSGRKEATHMAVNIPMVNAWGEIIEGENGDWLTTVYYKTEADARSTRLVLARSRDHGLTWTESSVIAGMAPGEKPWQWIGNEGPSEAGIVRLADRRLYVIFRTGGYLGESWSADDGVTWSAPESIGMKGVAPRVRRLSNGMLVCTYGRPGPVRIMFSEDGSGRQWSAITPIFGGMSTRYSDVVEVSPNRLLVVYDSVPYGFSPMPSYDRGAKNTIYGTFIELSP